jgi:Polysaccharide lyase
VVSDWHANREGSSPVAIAVAGWVVGADRWGIMLTTWNAPGDLGPVFAPWSAPVIRGVWNDIKVHIKWSVRDDVGFIEFWHDGAPQTFGAPCAGQTRCMVPTLMPGGNGVHFKQGYDRDPAISATGAVYCSGFSLAHTEADLTPL